MSTFVSLFLMAFRNMYRNPRRTSITLLSIGGGLAVLIWMDSVLRGYTVEMVQTVTSVFTGSVHLKRTDYAKSHSLNQSFSPSFADEKTRNIPQIAHADRIYFPSIISVGIDSEPLMLVGIQPGPESQITRLKDDLKEGEFLPDDSHECAKKWIYLGRNLAKKLDLHLGDKAVIMGQAADGTLGSDLYRVIGIFDTGSEDFDASHAYVDLACAAQISAVNGIHERVMNLPPGFDDLEVERSFSPELEAQGYRFATWRANVPEIAGTIRMTGALMKLITTILFSVISLGVVNSMLMGVFEQQKEFGVMLAIGTTPVQVGLLVLYESIILGIIAAALGILFGIAVIHYHQQTGFDFSPFIGRGFSATGFYFNPRIRPVIDWGSIVQQVGIEFAFVLVSGLIPAYRVARLDPIETMKD